MKTKIIIGVAILETVALIYALIGINTLKTELGEHRNLINQQSVISSVVVRVLEKVVDQEIIKTTVQEYQANVVK